MEDKQFKYDIIANKIIAMIARGDYIPGDKLPSESELIKRFDVSRVTLRESLKKLSMMGVLSIVQGSGTYVEEITPAKFMQPLFPLLAAKGGNIEDIYNIRVFLESGTCELAAEMRTDDDVSMLRTLVDGMDSTIGRRDYEAYSALDRKFHYAVQKASKNAVMVMIHSLFRQFIDGSIPTINHSLDIVTGSVSDHRQIFEAIRTGRRDLAGILMREHLIKAKNDLLEIIGADPTVDSAEKGRE